MIKYVCYTLIGIFGISLFSCRTEDVLPEVGDTNYPLVFDNLALGRYEAIDMLGDDSGNFLVLSNYQPTGSADIYLHILCANREGDMLWEQTYGQTGYEHDGKRILEADGGTYIIAGNQIGVNTKPYIAKIDGQGSVLWQQVYEENIVGSAFLEDMVIDESRERGYFVGSTEDVDVTKPQYAMYSTEDTEDVLVYSIQMDNGSTNWKQTYGFTHIDRGVGVGVSDEAVLVAHEFKRREANSIIDAVGIVEFIPFSGNIRNAVNSNFTTATSVAGFYTNMTTARSVMVTTSMDGFHGYIMNESSTVLIDEAIEYAIIEPILDIVDIYHFDDGHIVHVATYQGDIIITHYDAFYNEKIEYRLSNVTGDKTARQLGKMWVDARIFAKGSKIYYPYTREEGTILYIGQYALL